MQLVNSCLWTLFFVSLLSFGDVALSEYHVPLPFFMDSTWYVFLTGGVFSCFFPPCDHKLDFDISLLFEIRFNQSIDLFPPTSDDINARGGSLSSSYVVKYTM